MAIDRKAAARVYLEARRPMGVFAVRDIETGEMFVGSSVDLPSMLNRQRFQLEMGSHPNRALQMRWNAQSGTGFAFEVLDTIEPPDEPGYDPRDDLQALLDMWRERTPTIGS